MTCTCCQGYMAHNHFLDLQESGGEWWMSGWRCINCGHVFDPVLVQKRRRQEAAMACAQKAAHRSPWQLVINEPELPLDIAA